MELGVPTGQVVPEGGGVVLSPKLEILLVTPKQGRTVKSQLSFLSQRLIF